MIKFKRDYDKYCWVVDFEVGCIEKAGLISETRLYVVIDCGKAWPDMRRRKHSETLSIYMDERSAQLALLDDINRRIKNLASDIQFLNSTAKKLTRALKKG